MKALAIIVVILLIASAAVGVYAYAQTRYLGTTKHCQYISSKDTNPNSPFYGMNRGGWVCKTY